MRRPLSTFVPLVAFLAVAAGCNNPPDKPQATASSQADSQAAAEVQQLKRQLQEAAAETEQLKDQLKKATAESQRLEGEVHATVARADKAEAQVKELESRLANAPASAPTPATATAGDLPEVKPGEYKLEVTDNGAIITLSGGVKLEMLKIKAGDFMMGCDEAGADVKPSHHVVITKDFLLGKYEVTQSQYEAVMGRNPSRDAGKVNRLNVGPDNPVDSITPQDADAFAARVNQGVSSPTVRFTLPTEAQWEYACRAGTTGIFYHGDGKAWDVKGEFKWHSDSSQGKSHPVGQKPPNPWGLYDMYGNVWEWCADLYDPFYYHKSPEQDPQGPSPDEVVPGTARSLRGGSWQYNAAASCSISRVSSNSDPGHHNGFRLAAVPR